MQIEIYVNVADVTTIITFYLLFFVTFWMKKETILLLIGYSRAKNIFLIKAYSDAKKLIDSSVLSVD